LINKHLSIKKLQTVVSNLRATTYCKIVPSA